MSGTLQIHFSDDMPVSAVEVLTSDHQSVQRLAVRPDETKTVDVPSERSIVRIHLPSGRVVTLPQRDDLNYVVSRTDIEGYGIANAVTSTRLKGERTQLRSVGEIRTYQEQRSAATWKGLTDPGTTWLDEMYEAGEDTGAEPTLGDGVQVLWDPHVTGRLSGDRSELSFSPPISESPYRLRVTVESTTMTATLPGSLEWAYVRADDVGEGGALVTMRAASTSRFADTAGNYLARGDYYAAETMADWAEQAKDTLQTKMRDPFAAAVAGYLLLRLERYDLMHNWAKNLAEWFPNMSDGCVIWATQVLRQSNDITAAQTYLLKAAERGWPIFTEGTRLLSESLRRIGEDGLAALRHLEETNGSLIWSSPFTARIEGLGQRDGRAISFDLGYEASA